VGVDEDIRNLSEVMISRIVKVESQIGWVDYEGINVLSLTLIMY
jgi:hypothetical protein